MRVEHIGDATLYLGDCLDILPTLPKVDAVITDPPYGVNFKYASHDDSPEGYMEWCGAWFTAIRKCCDGPIGISCGLGNLQKWPAANWVLAWVKPNAMGRCTVGFNTWEPVLVYGRVRGKLTGDTFVVSLAPQNDTGDHPCPKPIGWAKEVLQRLSAHNDSVADPFMGSGTTGVACAQLGRKFIGIEREPKYFDIACRRIEQAYAQGRLFDEPAPNPTQEALAL